MTEQVSIAPAEGYGGSAEAIRYHYDVGRDFYRLWLDETMTYSCALWDGDDDDLHRAQSRKIAHHLDRARAGGAAGLLDIGCGWGALVQAADRLPDVEHIVGLTLSRDQADHVRTLGLGKVEVRLESWTEHVPRSSYDGIISVGAFEHFAKPEDSVEEKIRTYRHFFERCRDWLAPGGRMSLQTIAYGSMRREEASQFINTEIFPASDLPTLAEIAAAAEGVFEITEVLNHRLHYARTFEQWAANLRRRRAEAMDLVGEVVVQRYERYLKQSAIGFYTGRIGLLRLALRPISTRWNEMAAP
jgi:cyclopropane-fatty-acyl-phospholipid synthase